MSEQTKRYRVEKIWTERLEGELNAFAAEGWLLVAMYKSDAYAGAVTVVLSPDPIRSTGHEE